MYCLSFTSPWIIGSIIAMFAIIGYGTIILIFSYALGHALPILIIAYLPYFSENFAKEKIEKNIIILRKIAGFILIIVSVYLFWYLFISDHGHKKDNEYKYYNQLNYEAQKNY